MIGNDYKRFDIDDEDEQEQDSVFDPLIKLENGNEVNTNLENDHSIGIKSNRKTITNRLLGFVTPSLISKSIKYSSTLPSTSILKTNNNINYSKNPTVDTNNCADSLNSQQSVGSVDNETKVNRKCQKQNRNLDIQQSNLVRNKRCDNSTTIKNFKLNENANHLTKKKRLIVFIVFLLLVFCFNASTLMSWSTPEKIPVFHNSHVPGMKVNKSNDIYLDKKENYAINNTKLTNKTENNIKYIYSFNSSNYFTINDDYKYTVKTHLNDVLNTTTDISSTIDNKLDNNDRLLKMNSNNSQTNIIILNNKTTVQTDPEILKIALSESSKLLKYSTTIATSNITTKFELQNAGIKTVIPTTPPPGFLVWSDKCKMPNLDPYSPDVMKYFTREKYEECSKEEPLTSVKFNTTSQRYMLVFHEKFQSKFTKFGNQLSCCYQVIERNTTDKHADEITTLSACLSFSKTIQLPPTTDNILVKCKSGKKQTYIHGHAMMPERPEIRERINKWKANDTAKPISVLLMGIDSISRTNLIRAMPKTAQYLYDNEWFELSGYNKMDDNTFPNLMAILTGYNYTFGYETCKPTISGKLDKCPMIWKTFRDLGYVTAYAEDETKISTFNYLKLGFQKPPTDYYLRPFLLQAEHNFHQRLKNRLIFCLGYQHSADYVYDYALELATRYKDDPFFGLFWANTFSHNSLSDCSSMDLKMVEYLEKFSNRGILNNSVVVFFSDHGMRFGPTRKLLSGYYEERLPFMFISLPPWLKTKYPEIMNSLNVNRNRLTNPFDLHMTLKHILELSGRAKNLPKAPNCPNCQTLFKPVPQSRSCDEIAIADHWCTCIPYESIYKKSAVVKKVTNFAIEYINNYISTYKNSSIAHLCAKLHLHDIISSHRALLIGDIYPPNLEVYRVVFTTNPGGGMFEASIRRLSDKDEYEMTGSISRLNVYATDSKCIPDAGAKKYCHCNKHPSSSAAIRAPGG